MGKNVTKEITEVLTSPPESPAPHCGRRCRAIGSLFSRHAHKSVHTVTGKR